MRNVRQGLLRLAIVAGIPAVLYCIVVGSMRHGVSLGIAAANLQATDASARAIMARQVIDLYFANLGGSFTYNVLAVTPLLLIAWVAATWVWDGFQSAPLLAPARSRPIRTPRLVLRRALREDLTAIDVMMTDAETMRYWDRPPHGTLAETEAFLNRLVRWREGVADVFVIEREGRVIGFVGMISPPSITYLIGTGERGKGYAAEALEAFLAYAFSRRLNRLTVATDVHNAPSLALLRRVGFQEAGRSQGLYLVQGVPANAAHFQMTHDQYCALQAARGAAVPKETAAVELSFVPIREA